MQSLQQVSLKRRIEELQNVKNTNKLSSFDMYLCCL